MTTTPGGLFIERRQDKVLYGSDRNEPVGRGPKCQSSQTVVALRKLAGSKAVERKILYAHAKRLFRLTDV
ncbi:MAG: hypothetical protein C0483_24405 [Pirellula sp.]|nr:hypothetical protein [Pirellula sp.]